MENSRKRRWSMSTKKRTTKQALLCILAILSIIALPHLIKTKDPAPLRRESTNLITLFMKSYEQIRYDQSFITHNQEPQKPNILKHHRNVVASSFDYATDPRGVYVLYGGFVDTLDVNRQVRFPRLTQEDEVVLIITRKLAPVILRGNTVEYFLRDTNQSIAYYRYKRHFDPNNNYYYWNVQKLDLPHDTKIPATALIIFANPRHIFVPLEETIAVPGGSLVLPPIYATGELRKDYNATTFIDISPYFDPIDFITKIAPPQRYAQKISNV